MADEIGFMKMPSDFKYREVYLKGRNKHDEWDDFSIKHPPMPVSRWAKIYAPFDALARFDEKIRTSEDEFSRLNQ